MVSSLFDFAVTTIFAREFLEGAIIIGQYRTILLQTPCANEAERQEKLQAIWIAAGVATVLALIVIAAIAIPLAILSSNFDDSTSKIIEGCSKIVAGICLLGLSLKIPKFLEIYGSCKKKKKNTAEDESNGLTLRSIRFNVAWNIWREVAECGVFLIPFFLSGDNLQSIPLSAVIGSVAGLVLGVGIYWANHRFQNRLGLCIFAVLLLVFLSAGLLTGGVHNLEKELGQTRQVWELQGKFWDIDRLPMTIFKPFGYNDSRTILEICTYWGWLLLSAFLHYRKYKRAPKINQKPSTEVVADSKEDDVEERAPESDVEKGGRPEDEDDMQDSARSTEDDSKESSLRDESDRRSRLGAGSGRS